MVIFRTLMVIGLMIGVVPLLAEDVKRPSKAGASLDDELLKQLDDTLEDQPAAKHGHDHEHTPAADTEPAAGDKPSSTSDGAKSSNRSAKPSTDEELLKELDSQDDPSVGPKQEKAAADLGQNADPLTRIGAKMRQAVTLIDREKLSDKTTLLQDEIVKDIDELIKQQKKKMQQQQSSSQSKKEQQSSRSQVKPQGKQAQQQKQGQQPGGGGEQESKQAAKESEDRARKDQQKAVKLDPAAQDELLKRVWGLLPEKDREQMRQGAGDEFLPEYESLIIRYFRSLAEEEGSRP
ncbi:MAG: hypothetical protein K8T91_07135 [Planctomycetes bacterium]|nr:hypothetical protein [Planctomycetota bacterium]